MRYHTHVSEKTLQSIQKNEWLETNILGDYASSTLSFKNTRKYHGLLIANLNQPHGRHLLVSCLEDAIITNEKTYEISSREHDNIVYPDGLTHLISTGITYCPQCIYALDDIQICREIMLLGYQNTTLVRYTLYGANKKHYTLRIRPLLAFRNIHNLSKANDILCKDVETVYNGFSIKPYESLPTLFVQSFDQHSFIYAPDWYYAIEYPVEKERGYPFIEDLFVPGELHLDLQPYTPIIVSFSTKVLSKTENPIILWNNEVIRHQQINSSTHAITTTLSNAGEQLFTITSKKNTNVVAGYHWFDSWGRDTCISLPGLSFCTNNIELGKSVIKTAINSMRHGMIPNIFGGNEQSHAFNSIDTSLWFIWTLQQLILTVSQQQDWIYENCWNAIKTIIAAYRDPMISGCIIDNSGLIAAGTPTTQLSWMDASINEVPVTPRNGYSVEINALWYNALAFSGYLAKLYGESFDTYYQPLDSMQQAFKERFLTKGIYYYLGDVWNNDQLDTSIRPNQLFAISLPFPILEKEYHADVLRTVTTTLLTPYGLRTLSPTNPAYKGVCKGSQEERDQAYHQGTVWPWLLGAYGDALLQSAAFPELALQQLLFFLTPLFTIHLEEAGIGFISEIFDGDSPHLPRGCIAQAWSIGECIRLLYRSEKEFPAIFETWKNYLASYKEAPLYDTTTLTRYLK